MPTNLSYGLESKRHRDNVTHDAAIRNASSINNLQAVNYIIKHENAKCINHAMKEVRKLVLSEKLNNGGIGTQPEIS